MLGTSYGKAAAPRPRSLSLDSGTRGRSSEPRDRGGGSPTLTILRDQAVWHLPKRAQSSWPLRHDQRSGRDVNRVELAVCAHSLVAAEPPMLPAGPSASEGGRMGRGDRGKKYCDVTGFEPSKFKTVPSPSPAEETQHHPARAPACTVLDAGGVATPCLLTWMVGLYRLHLFPGAQRKRKLLLKLLFAENMSSRPIAKHQ